VGFLGDHRGAVAQFGELFGQVVELPLRVPPEGAELFAVLGAFFGQTGGDVLDAAKRTVDPGLNRACT